MKSSIPLLFLAGLLATVTLLPAETNSQPTPLAAAIEAIETGDTETARMLLEAVLADDPGNKSAKAYLQRLSVKTEANNALQNQMKAIVLPTVNLQDVAAREAFLYVSQQVEKQTEGKNHLNVVWLAPADAGNRITLALQNIPVSELLVYLSGLADLRVTYDRNAIKVLPALAQ